MQKGLKELYQHIEEAKSYIQSTVMVYVDNRECEYHECRGVYNDYMSRAMASDMFYFFTMFNIKHQEFADNLIDWKSKMLELNYRLLRMIDDNIGERPLIKWKCKKAEKFIKEIKEVMDIVEKQNTENSDELLNEFLEKCQIWIQRIVHINTWALYLEDMYNIEHLLMRSQIEEID